VSTQDNTQTEPVDELGAFEDIGAVVAPQTLTDYTRAWWTKVRGGDWGTLPIIIGIILIIAIFGTLKPVFFEERNFTNLLLQMAGTTTIAFGVVFVLLIAEIDLSVAYVSAVGGVVMTLLLRPGAPNIPEWLLNWPWWAAMAAALVVTVIIGLIHGLIITRFRVPSFVVTLAGLLAWSGVVLILTTSASESGAILIQNGIVNGIANNFLWDIWGWILGAAVVGGYAFIELAKVRTRRAQGLPHKPLSVIGLQIGGLAALVAFVVFYANLDRGIPMSTLLILALVVVWTFVATRTKFGRHVYAVGGNPEAARRAGINVDRLRVLVFMISSGMAGLGGIVLASRLRSVDTNAGGGNLLLNVIAAAVIGGTSLFGGQGRVVSALLGGIVIISVENGMGLLGLSSGWKFVITGLVLLAAVLVDALSKRGRATSGAA
jgi:D-xylose transport system permease protein